jgi:hypothetical protein
VDFVTAASNLRASSYGIPTQSAFAAKGMAGNIIHAIATTNAMVSGLLVVEAIKVLAGATAAARLRGLEVIKAPSKGLLASGALCSRSCCSGGRRRRWLGDLCCCRAQGTIAGSWRTRLLPGTHAARAAPPKLTPPTCHEAPAQLPPNLT